MTYIFSFSLDPEKNAAVYAGNIEIQQALQILQNLVIADAVNKARELDKQPTKDAIIKDAPDVSKSKEGG